MLERKETKAETELKWDAAWISWLEKEKDSMRYSLVRVSTIVYHCICSALCLHLSLLLYLCVSSKEWWKLEQ